MKYILVLSMFLFPFHISTIAQAQSRQEILDYRKLYESVVDEYGFDQVLVNGVIFEDIYRKKIGHQFFPEDKLYTGSIMYRGKEYERIELKYDICNQQLILFLKHNDLTVRTVPSNDFISSFSLGDKKFSKYNFQDGPRFYQVVFDTEKLKCLFYWSKQVRVTTNSGNHDYFRHKFTESERKSYLELNRPFEKFTNNSSFIDLFPQETKVLVRQYIKTNHIKVAKSSDQRITELLTYCNSLL